MPNRPALTATAGAVLLASVTSGVASAQSIGGTAANPSDVIVTATVAETTSSRQLYVTGLDGTDLDTLALTPGVPQAFRVSVRDEITGPLSGLSGGFTVSSVLTNLYEQGGAAPWNDNDRGSERIASADVALSSATAPLNVLDSATSLLPRFELGSAGITCSDIQDAVTAADGELTEVAVEGLLCGVLPVAGSLAFADLDLLGNPVTGIDLDLAADLLPLDLGGVEAGAYTDPDCASLADGFDPNCTAGTATSRRMLDSGLTIDALDAALQAALNGALPAELVTADTSGRATVGDVMNVLIGATDPALSTFAMTLNTLSPTTQLAVLQGANLTMDLVNPTLADITSLTGLYTAFPILTVDPSTYLDADEVTVEPKGNFSGTLTITLMPAS